MNYLELLQSENCLFVDLEKNIYSKSTIMKATYKFTDRAYIYIQFVSFEAKDYYRIYFKSKIDSELLLDSFMNELLDQELRMLVANETKKIREVIVSKALISGQLN